MLVDEREIISRIDVFLQDKKWDAALGLLEKYQVEIQDKALLYNLTGIALRGKFAPKNALKCFKAAIKKNPKFLAPYNNAGLASIDLADYHLALNYFVLGAKLEPKNTTVMLNMAVTMRHLGQMIEAINLLNSLISLQPNNVKAINNIGLCYETVGDFPAAISAFEKAIILDPNYIQPYLNLALIDNNFHKKDHFMKLKNFRKTDDHRKNSQLHFRIAKSYEDSENYERSFEYFKIGNQLRRDELNIKARDEIKVFDHRKAIQWTDLKKQHAEIKSENIPIFIIGMPRSGTTLLESFLATSADCTPLGELSYFDDCLNELGVKEDAQPASEVAGELGRVYLEKVKRHGVPTKYFIDKMPRNFLNVGYIGLSLPRAKVIHIRRDKAATCWSIWKRYFSANGHAYAYDAKDLLRYYESYEDLMKFWRKECEFDFFEVSYENLIFDTITVTQNIFEYLNLEWSERNVDHRNTNHAVKTASQQQVRKELYKDSRDAWRKFLPHNQKLMEKFCII